MLTEIPEMTPVEASHIKEIGYDERTRALYVRFRPTGRQVAGDGPLYRYLDFPPEEHAALMAAPSKGEHLSRRIRGVYKHEAVTA